MSDYFGDFRLGDTLDIKFTTRQISGAPFTLAGSPVISAYPGNSVTQLTAGITLTVDFDAVTGYNNVRVVASGGNGYATATNYDLCITTGTVNGVSVVGESIGSFSIENRSALMPTTPTLTLDVSATGEAGVDWANVGGKTTANNLSATTVNLTNTVTTYTGNTPQTGDNFARLGAPVGASISADIAEIEAETDLIVASTSGLTFTVANQVDVNVVDWKGAAAPAMTGDAFARLGAPAGASVSADIAAVKVDTAAIKVTTDKFVFTVANQVDANALSMATSLRAGIRKNVALAKFEFLMTDSTNHNPSTGLVVTVTRSIDGGAFGAGTLSAVTEVSNGVYSVDFGAGDLNGNVITLRCTAAASDDLFVTIHTDP